MNKFKKITVLLLLAAVFSCGKNVKYEDASKDTGSREWGPKEIKTTVNTMVTSMYTFLKNDYNKPVFIQVQRFANRTSDHLDAKMVTDEITTNLIKKRIKFIDAEMTKEALAEMEMGTTGLIDPDSAVPFGQLKSPNLYLYGDIRENMRTVGNKQKQYLVVTLKLMEVATRVVVWQEQQEFLKVSKKGGVTF
ncbi:MAG: hypothetical protein JW982_14035 [Spirochaetes bacterium]|nr:hypothetical protein [Spirochaetota bacterium]